MRIIEKLLNDIPNAVLIKTQINIWYALDNITDEQATYIKKMIYFYMKEKAIYPPEDFNLQEALKNIERDVSVNERKVNKIKIINMPDKIIINKLEYTQNHEVYVKRLEKAINNVLSRVKPGKTPMESSKKLNRVLNRFLGI